MRVVIEQDELQAKIHKLKHFLTSPAFHTLELDHQRLLHTQLTAMETYDNILDMRLDIL
jgi:hypothetical protein